MELVKYNKCEFNKNKLVIDETVTKEEWQEIGKGLTYINGSVQIWIGDWARFGEKKGYYTDTKTYKEISDITGYEPSTIKDFKYVAENTSSVRTDDSNVDFGILKQVASLQPEQQKEILQKAVDEKLTVNKVRQLVRIKKENNKIENNIIEYKNKDIEIIEDDCINALKDIPDNIIDLICIDPPFMNIVNEEWDHQWNNEDEYLQWCEKWIIESSRILKNTGSFYMWGMIGELSDILLPLKKIVDKYLIFKDWITLQKKRGIGQRKGWLYTREECLWYVKDNSLFYWNESEQYNQDDDNLFKKGMGGHDLLSDKKRITNIWTDIPESLNNGSFHYTPKPIKAMERIIKAHTIENMLVLDFFAGSGSTGIACKNINRKCILIEKNSDYVNKIKGALNG